MNNSCRIGNADHHKSKHRELSDSYISVIMQLTRGRLRLELVKIEYVQYCKEITVI